MSLGLLAMRRLSRLPIGLRRPLLRLVWRGWRLLDRRIGDYGAVPTIAHGMRVSHAAARRIEREIHFHDLLCSLEWLAASGNSEARMRADGRSVTIDRPDLLERIAATGEPVVLAPLHMGNLALGIPAVLDRFFAGRRVLLLRAREDLDVEETAMRRIAAIASELRIFPIHDKGAFLEAARFARQGGVVICFADLPASYGSPADVHLLGAPARIAFGVDALARAIRAVVVPLAVRSSLSGDRVICGRPFEVEGSGADERTGLAHAMARQIERFVEAAPAQWHLWLRLHEFRPAVPAEGVSDGIS